MNAAIRTVTDLFGAMSVEKGQRDLATRMRTVVTDLDPAVAAAIEPSGDNAYLEPLIFAYVVDPNSPVKLSEITVGSINPLRQPREIEVYADGSGTITLPKVGYLHTRVRNHKLQLTWEAESGACILRLRGSITPYTFEKVEYIAGTHVELSHHHHPLLRKFFVNENREKVNVHLRDLVNKHRDHIAKAFEIIAKTLPDYYTEILKVTKRIVLYSAAQPYSFTTLAAHGIAFLNTFTAHDEVFFIEDLLHQCGHLLFSVLTLEPGALLRIPADTPLRNLNGDPRDHRDIYTTLHGVFTEACMNLGLNQCRENDSFSARQKHELEGRFALILTRFGSDLRSIAREDIFTITGRQLLHWFFDVYREIVRCRYHQLSGLDISNQSYCFSYKRFLQVNPFRTAD